MTVPTGSGRVGDRVERARHVLDACSFSVSRSIIAVASATSCAFASRMSGARRRMCAAIARMASLRCSAGRVAQDLGRVPRRPAHRLHLLDDIHISTRSSRWINSSGPRIAEAALDLAAGAAEDRQRFGRRIGGDPARDFACRRGRGCGGKRRARTSPSTASTPAGRRLLPPASARTAPASTWTLPAGRKRPRDPLLVGARRRTRRRRSPSPSPRPLRARASGCSSWPEAMIVAQPKLCAIARGRELRAHSARADARPGRAGRPGLDLLGDRVDVRHVPAPRIPRADRRCTRRRRRTAGSAGRTGSSARRAPRAGHCRRSAVLRWRRVILVHDRQRAVGRAALRSSRGR